MNINNNAHNNIRRVVHTKFSEDNIIKKIKTYLMKYLDKKLNNSLHFTYKRFYKLNKKINEILEKDYKIRLMNMNIREIYEENSPNKIYDPLVNKVNKINYDLIQEIYDKNEEKETIEILNTKFIDFLNKIEAKEYIINEIEKKERLKNKDNNNIISYISKVRKLLDGYEKLFL